jgi:hypothetical protein
LTLNFSSKIYQRLLSFFDTSNYKNFKNLAVNSFILLNVKIELSIIKAKKALNAKNIKPKFFHSKELTQFWSLVFNHVNTSFKTLRFMCISPSNFTPLSYFQS